jgi:uncharacterized protein
MSRILIVHGGWPGHQPAVFTDLVRTHLEEDGHEVTVRDTLASFDDPSELARFDLIVPNWTMGQLSDAQEANLVAAVEAGAGLAGWHGGMGDAFRANLTYKMMVGGQFVAHPGGIRRYDVRIVDRDHPITAGVEDFGLTSEQYYLHVDPAIHVLASTTFSGETMPWIDGVTVPVAWTRGWGAGRVSYLSVGHVPDDLRIPPVWTMLTRGMSWAARKSVAGPAV